MEHAYDRNHKLIMVGDRVALWAHRNGGWMQTKKRATVISVDPSQQVSVQTASMGRWSYKSTLLEVVPPRKTSSNGKEKGMAKSKVVRWTNEEQELFYQKTLEVHKRYPGWSMFQVVRYTAKREMPEGRRRRIVGMQNVEPWYSAFKGEASTKGRNRTIPKAPQPQPSELPAKEEPKAGGRFIGEVLDEVLLRFHERLDGIEETLVRIEEAALDAATRPLTESTKAAVERAKKKPGIPPERRPTIVVVGLKSGLVHELKQAFGDRARIESFGPGDYARNLPMAARYFLATKFVPHKWEERLKAEGLMERTTRIKGGVSSFKDQMGTFLDSQEKGEK